MTRLSLMIGLFLSVTVTGVVFLLSLVVRVTFQTLLYRIFVAFFLFGLLGVGIGSFLEIVLMPYIKGKEEDKLKKELEIEDPHIAEELGDLLDQPSKKWPPRPANGVSAADLKPVVLSRVTVEKSNSASSGSSKAVL
ncbi:hypothetical protein AUK22_07750 [bacterium CG2_30_54_10]|nr:MAG: hypothetical protein AUK22_07750 [bacterium CG2_30_54_10]